MEKDHPVDRSPEEVKNDTPQSGDQKLYDVQDAPELGDDVKVVTFINKRTYLLKGDNLLPLDGSRGLRIKPDGICISWGDD